MDGGLSVVVFQSDNRDVDNFKLLRATRAPWGPSVCASAQAQNLSFGEVWVSLVFSDLFTLLV